MSVRIQKTQGVMVRTAMVAMTLLIGSEAWASPSYKDSNWGVVPQDNGRGCVVVLNSEDRTHAFHFLVDGDEKSGTIGILDSYLPEHVSLASTMVTVDLGPLFTRQLEFKRHADATAGSLAADLSRDDLRSILAALQTTRGVSLSFDNGEVWRIPPPQQAAASAISRCWKDALTGTRTASATVRIDARGA